MSTLTKHRFTVDDVYLMVNHGILPADQRIEVADTTYRSDRNTKAPLYAAEGVPVYWIVDLNQRQLEVYTNPKEEKYTQTQIHEGSFAVLGATITPTDIFPKK